MKHYFLNLAKLKKAILEGNIDRFEQASKHLIEWTSSEENQITLRDYHDDARNPIRNTNLVILASKYNQVNILEYLFDRGTIILNHLSIIRSTILPDDEDEEHHNAVYYAIRRCNIELLEILINKWPDNYFANHLETLDEILSRAYEELQLKNVPLSNEIEIFVEQKLINLRFFSNAPRNDDIFRGDLNNTIGRIELILQSISFLKTDYSNQENVDGKFLFLAKSVAQNIHILKRQLRSTYDILPWEEMEFCLVIFVSSYIKRHEINLFYRATLNKNKILNHLENFGKKLEEQKEITKGMNIKLFNLPKLQRAQVVAAIISRNPQFEELYSDYRQIRDVYSLEKISNSIKLALSADPKEREGQLIITRVLQVIGENLKHTLESPNLSNNTSELFLLLLPKKTRQILANLRNSLSHGYSPIEIEENLDINFFINVKNDTKKVGKVINDILSNSKIKTIGILLKKIVDSENSDDIIEVSEVLSTVQLDENDAGTFKMLEHERLENLFKALSDNITEMTDYENVLLNKMKSIIGDVSAQSKNNRTNYNIGFATLQTLTTTLNGNIKTDRKFSTATKELVNEILQNFTPKLEPISLKKIANLSLKILLSVESRIENDKLDVVQRLIWEIFYIAEFGTGDMKWIEELQEKLNAKGSCISTHNQRKTFNVTEGQYSKNLTLKLSELQTILSNHSLSGSHFDQLLFYKSDRKIQTVVEMLVLDVMSILGNSKLENNQLFLDDHTPLLTGKCLRNYLAHNNAVVDVSSSDPSIAVILNAEKLTEENLMRSKKKIGKLVSEDSFKLRAKYNKDLVTIINQERMFVALVEGNMETLKDSLKNGADINARSVNLWTTLHFAAKGPSLEIVKFLLDQNVSIKLKDKLSQTPLHIAAAYGRQDVVEFFIKEAGLCVDVRNNLGGTPLHVAVQNGRTNNVVVLLKNKANTVIHNVGGISPLHYAIRNDHIDIAKILLEKDVNVDINKTTGGYTPLHEAAQRGNLELVNFLLSKKADVNARTEKNWIPLHAAASGGHEEVLNALILKGADVNARIINGSSTLHCAVIGGHEKIANILLKHGANVNAAEKSDHYTPLHYATTDGYFGIVKTLLNNKANANAATVEGITALHFAAQRGHLDIVTALLKHGVDIHAKDKNNNTPLHYAAASGQKEVADLLIKNIGKINGNNNYITTLHVAALKGHKDVVDLLIKNEADVNARDTKGNTPLCTAAIIGSQDIVELLIQNKAKINGKTSDGMTPLHVAALNGYGNVVDFLLKNKAEVNAVDNNYGLTALNAAVVTADHKDVVQLLLQHKAEVDPRDSANNTPLHAAVIAGHKQLVEILAANGANINTKNGYCTPLISAINNKDMDIVEILTANGADVNANSGEALLLAVFAGYTDIVNILLEKKAIINMRNAADVSPLDIAARRGHNKIVKALIKSGADVDSVTANNLTPLFFAALGGHEEVVRILIANGANVNVRCDDDTTPLHLAALNGHVNVVKLLLDNQANINVKEDNNMTPIEIAVANGHLKVVVMLLQCKHIVMNAKSNYNLTLLHIASEKSNLELIKYLVDEGFDINAKNCYGSKPIHIAAREGYKDTVEYFLSKGLNINDTGVLEQTLLHYTSFNGHLEVVKYLIEQGADVNAQDALGVTAMHIAARYGYKDVIEVLLQNGAVYNAVNKLHKIPLHLAKNADVINLFASTDKLFGAAKRNSSVEIENYIKAGAYVNAKNVEGVTPLHYAAWKGFDKVVNVLLKNKANPNVVGHKGLTPLHYAAKFSHLKIIKSLLSKHAVYNAASAGGKTPSDFTVDERITSLFKLVNKAFKQIKNGNSRVVNDLNKITDIDTVKAVMCACDRENRTLVVAAVHSNFSKIDQLKEISQGDLSNRIAAAMVLLQQDNHETALPILESAWEKRKEILGTDNPGTLDIQTHIASVLCKQGAYPKALNILEEIFQKQEKMLGSNNKDTLITRGIIASVLDAQGKNEEAYNIFQDVYQKQKEILGPDHSDTLFTQLDMALALDRLGKYEEALNMNRTVFQKRKAILGTNHPVAVQAQNNIAMVLSHQGKYEEALKIYNEVYEKKKMVLGVNHSDTLRTLDSIAGILFGQHKHHEALKAYQEVFNIQEDVFGPNHPDTLNTQYNMANIILAQCKWIDAFKAYKEVVDKMIVVFGPSHCVVINGLKQIEMLNSIFKSEGRETMETLQYLQNDINIAAGNGDIQTVQRLLKNGTDPNEKDIDERIPLHYAVNNGHIGVVKILLNNGAEVAQVTSKGNTTLLHNATSKGYKEIVDVLLQYTSRNTLNEYINVKTTANGDTSLHIAVNNGYLHITKSLLKRGAIYNINNNKGKTPLDLFKNQYEYNLLKLVEELFEDAKNGDVEIIGKLRQVKLDDFKAVTNARNNEGNTLLQVAISNKHKNVANKLLGLLKKSDQEEQANIGSGVNSC